MASNVRGAAILTCGAMAIIRCGGATVSGRSGELDSSSPDAAYEGNILSPDAALQDGTLDSRGAVPDSSISEAGSAADGEHGDESAPDAVVTQDAFQDEVSAPAYDSSADDAPPVDSAYPLDVEAGVDASQCNVLSTGPQATLDFVDAVAMGTWAGGAIENGTYVATAVTTYGALPDAGLASCGVGPGWAEVWVVVATDSGSGTIEFAQSLATSAGALLSHGSDSYTTDGSTISLTPTCGSCAFVPAGDCRSLLGPSTTCQYLVTTSGVVLACENTVCGSEVTTYTRQ
jgi:hypothetical protein